MTEELKQPESTVNPDILVDVESGEAIVIPPKKVGRPSDFTQELADEICAQLAIGTSLRTVCASQDMPTVRTVFNWFRTKPDFLQQYARAKEESSEAMNEELMVLGDIAFEAAQEVDPKASGAVVQAVKLKADNLKWMMSKMKPKKFGDKLDMTTNGKDLPTPILNHVHSDNGNQESPQPQEAN